MFSWGIIIFSDKTNIKESRHYQLVMNLSLSKISYSHMLRNKLFAQVGSIEESCKSFKSRLCLASHVDQNERLQIQIYKSVLIY